MPGNMLSPENLVLKNFLEIIEKFSGLRICIYDFENTSQKDGALRAEFESRIHSCSFCAEVKKRSAAYEQCFACDHELSRKAKALKKMVQHTCHAGLNEMAFPIFSGKRYLGCVLAGQAFFRKYSTEETTALLDHLSSLGVNRQNVLKEFKKVPIIPAEALPVAVKSIKMLLSFIIEKEGIAHLGRELESAKKVISNKMACSRPDVFLEKIRLKGLKGYYEAAERIRLEIKKATPEKMTLKFAASIAGTSPCHVSRIFRKAGMGGFRNFVLQLKIERAEEHIMHSSMSLSEIAYVCGYEDLSSFSRSFKKVKGMYPGRFRQLYGDGS